MYITHVCIIDLFLLRITIDEVLLGKHWISSHVLYH